MFSWAPGVPSIAGVDYIFEETKGEYTWAYLVDTGVAYRHWVCVSESSHESRAMLRVCYQEFEHNWSGAEGYGKTNIDEDWIYASGVSQGRDALGSCNDLGCGGSWYIVKLMVGRDFARLVCLAH